MSIDKFKINQFKNLLLDKPIKVRIRLSSFCNLRCKQCNVWKSKEKAYFNFYKRKIIIKKLIKWLGPFHIRFSGGEPFLNSDIIQTIKFCEDNNLKTLINTNGTLITEKMVKKIKNFKNTIITISLDSSEEKIHDTLRGKKGTYKKVLNTIYLFKKYKFKSVRINTVISENNYQNLTSLVNFVKNNKLDGISFQPIDLYSYAKNKLTVEDFKKDKLWPKNLKKLNNEIDKLIKIKKDNKNLIFNSIEDFNNYKKYFKNPFSKKIHCNLSRTLLVDENGDIRFCIMKKNIIGNIFKDNLNEIYFSKKSKKFQEEMLRCTFPCKTNLCNKNYKLNLKQKISTLF